jgi:senataxin
VFQKLMHGFDTVLIDEAGQATELETLTPLQLGCTRAVLVGDPNQLPATVLSRDAAALNLQRSLFERLQVRHCGGDGGGLPPLWTHVARAHMTM